MRRVFLLWAVSIAILIPASAQAQGVNIWLQNGVSGVGAVSGFGFGSNLTGLLAAAGYSYKGVLEFDVEAQWDHFSGTASLDTVPLSVGVAFHPIKQSKEMPISLAFQGFGGYTLLSGDELNNQGLTAYGWDVSLAAGVYRFFPLAERVGLTPEFYFGWSHTSTTASFQDTGEQLSSTSDDAAFFTLGANLGFLDGSGHIWGLTPVLAFGTGPTTFTLNVSFVAPLMP